MILQLIEPEKEEDKMVDVIRIYEKKESVPLRRIQIITTEDSAQFTYFIKNISRFTITHLFFDFPDWVKLSNDLPAVLRPGKRVQVDLVIDTTKERNLDEIKVEPRITMIKVM